MLTVIELFFFSGATSLALEVLWMKLFTRLFGVTLYSSTAVLAAFMGGIALGSLLAGRSRWARFNPLRLFAVLQLGIGFYSLLVPYAVDALAQSSLVNYSGLPHSPALALALRFTICLLLLLFPTVLMGATLPVLCRLGEGAQHGASRFGAKLYAVNTAGAVAGTLAVYFLLMPRCGIAGASMAVSCCTLAIGIAAWAISGDFSGTQRAPEAVSDRRKSKHPPGLIGSPIFILAAIGLSGFAALSYEVIWMRTLSIVTYDTTFSYCVTLAVYLGGIALGSCLFKSHSEHSEQCLRKRFILLQTLIAIYGISTPLLIEQIETHYGRAFDVERLSKAAWGTVHVLKPLILAALVLILPTVLFGYSMPLMFELHSRRRRDGAQAVGMIYAWNTLGAILGAGITGMILIPAAGSERAIVCAAAANILAGAAIMVQYSSRHASRVRWAYSSMFIIIALLGSLVLPKPNRTGGEAGRLIFSEEDAAGLAEVFEDNQRVRTLIVDRTHAWGSNTQAMVYSMRKQGYLPLMLHPHPETVIEIGLGTGINFAPFVLDERVKRAEIVEISPAVVHAAENFAAENANLLRHPKLHLVIDDGRMYLQASPRLYDVLVLGNFVPYRPGSGHFFTEEFYRTCRNKLNDDGLIVQWLPLNQLALEDLKSIVRTFLKIFPHATLWERGQFAALVSKPDVWGVDGKYIETLFTNAALRKDLSHWGLRNPAALLSTYLLGSSELIKFAGNAPISTADRLAVEFSKLNLAAANRYTYAADNLEALLQFRSSRPVAVEHISDITRVSVSNAHSARGYALAGAAAQARGNHAEAFELFSRAAAIFPADDIARDELIKYRALVQRVRLKSGMQKP